eukprot:scaffold6065_cov154-Skeletonema_menzelii.AAC.7
MTYNISKLGIGVVSLDPSTVRVGVEEEGGHVTLWAVRVLVLLSLLALSLDHDFFGAEGINVVAITHGWEEGVVLFLFQMKSDTGFVQTESHRRQKRFHGGFISATNKRPARPKYHRKLFQGKRSRACSIAQIGLIST